MKIKKILSFLIVISMLFTMFTTVSFAADEATLVVSSVSAKRGEIVNVAVTAENNPGIAVAGIKVNYDVEALKLTNVEDGGIWGAEVHSDKLESPYTLFWNNSTAEESITADGVIATLTFEVLEEAEEGDYDITLEYDYEGNDIIDSDKNIVAFDLVAGKITVTEKPVEPAVGTLTVSEGSAEVGETVEITVTAENNPGIAVAGIKVNYDDTALKLTNVADGEIWGEAMHSDKRTSPCTLFWDNSTAEESITANGVIATLTFEVLEEAEEGDYDITLAYDYEGKDIIDSDKNIVAFELLAGKITVTEPVPPVVETYDVVFVADGKVVATKTVNEGEALAVADFPEVPVKEYHDGAWNVKEDITEATTVIAEYTRRTFEVTFVIDGKTVATKNVNEGEALEVAGFPEAETREGYTFTWDTEEAVTEAKIVTGVYTAIVYGDVNGDNKVNNSDLMVLERFIAEWEGYVIIAANADIDADGTPATLTDLAILARHRAKWVGYETLPCAFIEE